MSVKPLLATTLTLALLLSGAAHAADPAAAAIDAAKSQATDAAKDKATDMVKDQAGQILPAAGGVGAALPGTPAVP
ncbi:MAG TPA: hypothetical protein PLR02_15480, partial [Rhodocyclaceae bacterium]|nr:hypothetical protein [Rhodocyclaceae bacterium]